MEQHLRDEAGEKKPQSKLANNIQGEAQHPKRLESRHRADQGQHRALEQQRFLKLVARLLPRGSEDDLVLVEERRRLDHVLTLQTEAEICVDEVAFGPVGEAAAVEVKMT